MAKPQPIQCSRTRHCANDACFWRQRDVHGRSPWAIFDDDARREHDAKLAHLPNPIFPEMKTSVGTNCIFLTCEGYQPLEGDSV